MVEHFAKARYSTLVTVCTVRSHKQNFYNKIQPKIKSKKTSAPYGTRNPALSRESVDYRIVLGRLPILPANEILIAQRPWLKKSCCQSNASSKTLLT
uniref:Uncharacterized protein n=1 Tax=Panagrellus redivivus TaxID=6233 RepID=A0A7E4ZRC9_PANRE